MNTTKALVQHLLENPSGRQWTLQGLGMLRTYLDDDHAIRLHVWTTDHAAEVGASELHTHPWDFRSEVVAGVVVNKRFGICAPDIAPLISNVAQWQQQKIKCGEGGCLVGDPEIVWLTNDTPERYTDGQEYEQTAEEIHCSSPIDGTVTIIHRNFGTDTEHAYVYFPVGEQWVSAEPRPATRQEVAKITQNALDRWFL